MDYEQKQREAFYLIKKYSSLTWYSEIHRLWTRFCVGYEDMLHHPEVHLKGEPVTSWWEQNFRMFWGYAADMEEGLAALRQGDKANGYEYLASGCRFNQWLHSRRFEEMDLSELGHRRYKGDGANEGIFADAQRACDMGIAAAICRHTDDLRRDYVELQDKQAMQYEVPVAAQLKIPYGVPVGELPPLPSLQVRPPL